MGGMTAQELEQNHQRTRAANRLLCWVLPVALLGVGADLFQWRSRVEAPPQPLPPSLEDLTQPLPAVGAAGLSAGSFEQGAAPALAPAGGQPAPSSAPVAQGAQWKLRGVMLAGGKRAFLEDEAGKGVWVTEGEQVGSTRVKEIRERAVVMEGAGGEYEIRM